MLHNSLVVLNWTVGKSQLLPFIHRSSGNNALSDVAAGGRRIHFWTVFIAKAAFIFCSDLDRDQKLNNHLNSLNSGDRDNGGQHL